MPTPQIVLVITDKEKNAQLKGLGVSLLEIRVDLFKNLDVDYCLAQVKNRRALKIPLLLTVRNQKKEGALKEFADAKKLALMKALMPFIDWVDIELSSPVLKQVLGFAKAKNKKVVVSAHNFNNLPSNVEQLINKSLKIKANMVKFAFVLNAEKDLMSLIQRTYKHRQSPIITMGMGRLGALSRLVLPALGSRWIYTFLSKPTAPGQLNIKTLQEQLALYYA